MSSTVGDSLGFAEPDDTIIFVEDDPPREGILSRWKVAVIDDDVAVQDGTRFALYDYMLDGYGLELLYASSAAEGLALLAAHPDVAVVLLDVVMETETAGLDLVEHIRRELKNDIVRIILRTGQPGQAPERRVIVDYDINDYKAKAELTATRLFTTVTAALRSYQQLKRMAATRRGLEIIIEATADLGDLRSIRLLAEGVLTQIASLLDVSCAGILVLRESRDPALGYAVLAGSGSYRDFVGQNTHERLDAGLRDVIDQAFAGRRTEFTRERTVLYIGSDSGTEIVVVLDTRKLLSETDRALLGIFCDRLSASIDNLLLYEQLQLANRTLEQRVATRTEELAAANRRLHDQWQRARGAKNFQSEILGTVAHDLKNPLSVVMGRAEIIAELVGMSPFSADRCVAQLDQIKESARRMTAMVDTLVSEAMRDALAMTIHPENGDLIVLVADVIEANRPLAEKKQQHLVAEAAIPSIKARFDQDRLRDALDNLVSNAVKYSPPGAAIVVTAAVEDQAAVIAVTDEGPGLQPEDFERLFGKFQRLSAKPTGGESSTGLGLFSAKRIIDGHGGTLTAHPNDPRRGTTFTLRLPREGSRTA